MLDVNGCALVVTDELGDFPTYTNCLRPVISGQVRDRRHEVFELQLSHETNGRRRIALLRDRYRLVSVNGPCARASDIIVDIPFASVTFLCFQESELVIVADAHHIYTLHCEESGDNGRLSSLLICPLHSVGPNF